MRNDKLIPGIVLIMIGAVILLHNYGYVDVHWSNFIYLWPVFIVIGGINLIFAHNRSAWATILKLAVIIAGFGLIVFGNFGNKAGFWPVYSYHYDGGNDDNDDDSDSSKNVVKVEGNSVFNEPYTAAAKVARLNISGGGTIYNLSDTTNQLFNANTQEFTGKYEFKHRVEDSVYVLDFNMKNSHHNGWHGNDKTNSATFKLNPNPEWDINVETGATKLNFDLTKFKIKSFKISGGAASFDVKLGQPLAVTNVVVETGVSEVTINIPQNAACRVTTDSGLSSNNFEGFTKKENNVYETPDFGAAKNKLYIHMSGGVSDFKVRRY
jgi:hypothetical protein